MPTGLPRSPRATIRLLAPCDNHCAFCAQRDDALDALDVEGVSFSSQLAHARSRHDELTFVGGEPLLHPSLERAVARAREAGFHRIGVQSNARLLRDATRVMALRRAGLTDVQTTVLGPTAAVHDYHTEVTGSFAQTLAGIGAARSEGLTVTVSTVLTRSNARSLADVPKLLSTRGVAAWCVAIPRSAGALGAAFDRVFPRLSLALPFALHALESARALRIVPFVSGAPLCLLGPHAERSLDDPASDAGRAFADAPCASCPVRPRCPGLDPVYLARFHGDELSARGAALAAGAPPPHDEGLHALARTFAGAGPLVDAADLTARIHEPPARARVALPVLGRAQPAVREARAGAPRQSGEALREIFPDLFRDEPPRDPDDDKGRGASNS